MLPPRHRRAARQAFWTYWPRRLFTERGLLVIALLAALLLMVTSQVAPHFMQSTRAFVFDKLRVTLTAMATPAKKISILAEHVTGLSDMSSDLTMLRAENARLHQWYDRARQLEAENRSLRSLVHLADLPQSRSVTARVIASNGGSFAQSVIVDAGMDDHVSPQSVAMTGDGVVGRTMNVSAGSAHVLLLTDVNSRIPVVIENSRHRGILAGDNSPQPLLLYLPDDASVTVGERVLTSGDAAGIYAPGLPVGIVVAVSPRNIRIQPFADLRRLDFVQLIDFGRNNTAATTSPSDSAPSGATDESLQ